MAELVRNKQLDGLRGYAAMAVVVFHCVLDRDHTFDHRIVRPTLGQIHGVYNLLAKLVFIAFNGEAAVMLFFILSGAVLFNSLRTRNAPGAEGAIGFVVRRTIRLYPTFALALLVTFLTFVAVGAYAFYAPHVMGNLALVDFSVLGTSWTLQIEFLAIPFILAAFWSHRKIGAAGIVVVYIIFALFATSAAVHEHLLRFARFLPCFAFGMLIPKSMGARVIQKLPRGSAVVAGLGMLAIRSVLGLHWWSATVEESFAATFVGILYYNQSRRLGAVFETPFSQYLGRISYSLYLFNVVVLTVVDVSSRGSTWVHEYPLEMGLLLSIPVVAGGMALAHLAERFLERPSIAWAHRIANV